MRKELELAGAIESSVAVAYGFEGGGFRFGFGGGGDGGDHKCAAAVCLRTQGRTRFARGWDLCAL